MDKQYDGHCCCKMKIKNIQNDFGLNFQQSTYACHLECQNDGCNYFGRNSSMWNYMEWDGITPSPFFVGSSLLAESALHCKVCYSTPICLVLCDVVIYYVHCNQDMTHACIHLGHHEHPLANGVYRKSADLVYQCFASEVYKTPTAKNFAVVIAASKHFFFDYLLKTQLLERSIMDKFSTLSSPNYRNFVEEARRFVCNGTYIINSIMALKDDSKFKYIHNNRFPR
jgi:hypothetical protein